MPSFSQANKTSKELISNNINNYFLMDRENIHVQFNKDVFFTSEDIWFKGYVYNRKTKTPFKVTTNVFLSLIGENGTKIKDQLVYAQNGSFSGNFEADSSLKSGTYYIQVYTNWMNNFAESEAFIQKIQILNKKDSEFAGVDTPAGSPVVAFHPEGGQLVQGTSSVLGIRIQDCNNQVTSVTEAGIFNSKGEQVKKVFIDKSGYGKFDLPWGEEQYILRYNFDGKGFEKPLPKAQTRGFALDVNNYSLPGKTLVNLSSNKETMRTLNGEDIYLVVHQDDNSAIFDVKLDPETLKQQLVFSNAELSEGVNTLRLVDGKLNQLAERLIFQPIEQNTEAALKVTKHAKDSVTISGAPGNNMNLSISVLPGESIASRESSGIFSSFLLHPYVNEKVWHNNYVFSNPTKAEHYELDLFLLNQKSGKYTWKNIMTNAPVDTYKFDLGVQIKGSLNPTLKNFEDHRIQLFSVTSDIDEATKANKNREFYFDNLILADSSWINLGVYDKRNMLVKTSVFPEVINGKGKYVHAFQPKLVSCNELVEKKTFALPAFAEEFVQLDEVELQGRKVEQFEHQNDSGNRNLTAFKVSERDESMYRDVLQFIEANSTFTVENSQGRVSIFSRQSSTISSARVTPIVYLNNIQLFDLSILSVMRMYEVAEVYINAQAIVASVRNNIGIVKIYTKAGYVTAAKDGVVPFQVVNGFAIQKPFENSFYYSTSDRGFKNFGLVHWIPTVLTNDEGKIEFQAPKLGQEDLRVRIEGFAADGTLISEERNITVN
ncbi:hypothetical protein ES724_02855 [Gillisia hiemivivida]|uniref:Macroglobulin domain-containing protein n=2 Tax=Gillisia hiemivivida TaxID=291190 RepID=A0A5C6ZW12_9FLAO|nr:hypothetical protein ES724_02855 [Gillisia hiemivivida]